MAMNERELGQREFGNLIGSDKVEGTAVYGPDESKIGSIERVMIDKMSGRVSYALGFGGFLGAWQRSSSPPLAVAEIRHTTWRLSHRDHRGPVARRAQIPRRERLELE